MAGSMAVTNLGDQHHILRFVKHRALRRDENDNVVGVLGEAFRLRDGESFLSAAWIEHYSGNTHEERIAQSISTFCNVVMKVKKKDAFVSGNVQDIKLACAQFEQKIRVVSEPDGDHAAHVAIRQYRDNNDELLELLAGEVWAQVHFPAPQTP